MSTWIVRAGDRRRSETPNAVMTTCASPSVGGSADLSLWWVEMAAGATGPVHVLDSEQLWSLVEGRVQVELDGVGIELDAGDTAVLPAGVPRQLRALASVRAVVCGAATTTARVPGERESRGTPPWIS